MPRSPPTLVFGQPAGVVRNQLRAVVLNVVSWLRSMGFMCFSKPKLPAPEEPPPEQQAVSIPGPGGLEQLQLVDLAGRATVGSNVREFCLPPFTPVLSDSKAGKDAELPKTCVLVKVGNFSVNYADITIRWGLYESAVEFVGWPIVPGFDISGIVEWAGKESGFKEGQRVFGVTLFGGYTTHCLVPNEQLLHVPKSLSMAAAAAAPAVSATALHAVALAGFWPRPAALPSQRAALVHSAAGGVGTMLLQVCRLCGFSPIVAVVGSPHKGAICRQLGADVVIDKSSEDLWERAREVAPDGFAAIFDANGLSTMKQGYEHLAMCGRMVLYGFHSNLPTSTGALNPLNWVRMALGMLRMPRFDGMRLVLENRAVLGFNLSFFEGEKAVVKAYLQQLGEWFASGDLRLAKVTELPVGDVAEAHTLIQSGKSVGKIVLRTACAVDPPLECDGAGGLMGTRDLCAPGGVSLAGVAGSVGVSGAGTRGLQLPGEGDAAAAAGSSSMAAVHGTAAAARGLQASGAGDMAAAVGGSTKAAATRDVAALADGDGASRGRQASGAGDMAAAASGSTKAVATRDLVAPVDGDGASRGRQASGAGGMANGAAGGSTKAVATRDVAAPADGDGASHDRQASGAGDVAAAAGGSTKAAATRDVAAPADGHAASRSRQASGAGNMTAAAGRSTKAAAARDVAAPADGDGATRGRQASGAGDVAAAAGGSTKAAATRDFAVPADGDGASRGRQASGAGDVAAAAGGSTKAATTRDLVAPADGDGASRGRQASGAGGMANGAAGGSTQAAATRDVAALADGDRASRGLQASGAGDVAAAAGASMQAAATRDLAAPADGDAASRSRQASGAGDLAEGAVRAAGGLATEGAPLDAGRQASSSGLSAAASDGAGSDAAQGKSSPGRLQLGPKPTTLTAIKRMMAKWTPREQKLYNDTLQQFDDNLLAAERCIRMLEPGMHLTAIKSKARRTELFEALAKVTDAIDKLNKGEHGNHDFMAAAFGASCDVERLPRLKRLLTADVDIDAEPTAWCVKALTKQDIDSMHTKTFEHLIRSYKAAYGIAHDHDAHHHEATPTGKIAVRNITETQTPKASVVRAEMQRRSLGTQGHAAPAVLDALRGLDASMSTAEQWVSQYSSMSKEQRSTLSGMRVSVELMKAFSQLRDSMVPVLAGGSQSHAALASEMGKGSQRASRLLALINGGGDLEGEATGGILKLMAQDPAHLGQHANASIVASLSSSYKAALGVASDVHA